MTFQEVYEEHFPFVWRSLRRLGVREADVADAVQDVFVVVHRRLGDFEGTSKMTTWLYGICFRVAKDRRRVAHIRRETPDGDETASNEPDAGADAVSITEKRQGLAVLEAILDEMPMEQRAVFTLFELEATEGETIAEMLDVPLGTVYSRLRLAREHFRKSLARRQARERFMGRAGGDR